MNDPENMAKATEMSTEELVGNLRAIGRLYEGTLAKWVIGVAAERIEKCAHGTKLIEDIERRTVNALCYIGTDVKEAARQLRHARDNARELVKTRAFSSNVAGEPMPGTTRSK